MDDFEFEFIESQRNYLWATAALMLMVVLVISYYLASHLVSPIVYFRRVLQKSKQGYFVQLPHTRRNDEIGALYNDYNHLITSLQSYDNTRKKWLANISHEILTLALIRHPVGAH